MAYCRPASVRWGQPYPARRLLQHPVSTQHYMAHGHPFAGSARGTSCVDPNQPASAQIAQPNAAPRISSMGRTLTQAPARSRRAPNSSHAQPLPVIRRRTGQRWGSMLRSRRCRTGRSSGRWQATSCPLINRDCAAALLWPWDCLSPQRSSPSRCVRWSNRLHIC